MKPMAGSQDSSSADGQLLDRYRSGEMAAFETLLRRHEAALLRYAEALSGGDRNSAEDLVQETFLRLVRRKAQVQINGSAAPWLFRVCRNLAFDRAKMEVRERQRREKAARPAPWQEASAVAEQKDLHGFLEAELRRLEPKTQDLLRRKMVQGATYKEIADQTGLKSSYVAWAIRRGIQTLSERLQARGMGLESLEGGNQ
ncbi:MAG: RNA polymerase sigma factor [Planctomycetota bacterium]|nr:MAG: RNA polymerase sigma factor [Planctomycetota bacterium]